MFQNKKLVWDVNLMFRSLVYLVLHLLHPPHPPPPTITYTHPFNECFMKTVLVRLYSMQNIVFMLNASEQEAGLGREPHVSVTGVFGSALIAPPPPPTITYTHPFNECFMKTVLVRLYIMQNTVFMLNASCKCSRGR